MKGLHRRQSDRDACFHVKDPGAVMEFHARPGARRNPPVTIEPRLSEVERLLR